MNYRIKQVGDRYYPQYKRWFRWKTYQKWKYDFSFDEVFTSLKDAKQYIESKEKLNKIIIHPYP